LWWLNRETTACITHNYKNLLSIFKYNHKTAYKRRAYLGNFEQFFQTLKIKMSIVQKVISAIQCISLDVRLCILWPWCKWSCEFKLNIFYIKRWMATHHIYINQISKTHILSAFLNKSFHNFMDITYLETPLEYINLFRVKCTQ